MFATKSVSPEALAEIEEAFRAAWTGANSTPFIVDAPVGKALRDRAEEVISRVSLSVLFQRCPTLAVWAVLTPLSRSYGANTSDVYLHISRFTKEDFGGQSERSILKSKYRVAARKIGLPVSGNEPTELFFVPLGPPQSRHADLASAFVAAALYLGPPAIEDTPSARSWQRRAVRDRCATIPRLLATIDFDVSAHCARRFEAWRKGIAPHNETETALFEAYDRAARRFGRTRSDLTGPPQVYWTGDRLAIEAERSSQPQQIKTGPFPVQIKSGARHVVPAPWPSRLSWRCGTTTRDIPFGPAADEVLLFDADSGSLLARVDASATEIEVAASRIVVLASRDFATPTFGQALPAADPGYRVAWLETGDSLDFDDAPGLKIATPSESAIWIDGSAVARSGSRALVYGDGAVVIKLDPEIGGSSRIVRAHLGSTVKYSVIELRKDGTARIPFKKFGFPTGCAPSKAVFEVLAPGAADNFEARAELAVTTWLWPDLDRPDGPLLELPCPSNFNDTRSAGLRQLGQYLSVDLAADVEAPILGLDLDGLTHEFTLRTGAEVLHHHRLERQDKILVPRGARIALGHSGRHDTLILQSSDREADLLVLGQEVPRPFFARKRFEITAELLERGDASDDRIALRRKDGRVDIFARLLRRDDPQDIEVYEDEQRLILSLLPQERTDALRVRVEPILTDILEGEYSFGRHLLDLSPLPGIVAHHDIHSGRFTLEIDKGSYRIPARLTLWTRCPDHLGLHRLEDGAGIPIAIGLGEPLADPDQRSIGALAQLAAEPSSAMLTEQIRGSIGRAYKAAMENVGKRRLVGAVRPAMVVSLASGKTPRHDLVGVAPWIFEATPHAFRELPEACGLAGLSRILVAKTADNIPDPQGETPVKAWLERLAADDELPQALSATTLNDAFAALRFRLKESDLSLLLSDEAIGMSCACLYGAWVEEIEALRDFDKGGGGDPRAARIAAALERFARASALGGASRHLDDLAFRTGLSLSEVGECLTLMLRAGIEIFAYFRALWSDAASDERTSR